MFTPVLGEFINGRSASAAAILASWCRQSFAFPVGAPLVTPGAGTAQRRDHCSCRRCVDVAAVRAVIGGRANVYTGFRRIQNGRSASAAVVLASWCRQSFAFPVGAPLVTPGAGTAQRRDHCSCRRCVDVAAVRAVIGGRANVYTGFRRIQNGRSASAAVVLASWCRQSFAFPVGAPLVTPGAGTAQRRDALFMPAVRGCGGSAGGHRRLGECLHRF